MWFWAFEPKTFLFLGHQKEAEEEELLENCSEDEDFH